MSFGREYSEESKPTSFCSVCGAKISPKSIFCFECGPPDLPKKEPEEIGISLEQAVVRIAGLIFLFVCVALVKFYVSTDDLVSLTDNDKEVQSSIDGKSSIDENHRSMKNHRSMQKIYIEIREGLESEK